MKEIICLIGIIITLIGVVVTYDARTITKKYFSSRDENQVTNGLKILGLIIALIGAIIICIILK